MGKKEKKSVKIQCRISCKDFVLNFLGTKPSDFFHSIFTVCVIQSKIRDISKIGLKKKLKNKKSDQRLTSKVNSYRKLMLNYQVFFQIVKNLRTKWWIIILS